MDDVRLSKAVSHALRHAPWVYELELDAEGWAPVEQLVAALREKGGRWEAVDSAAIERMMASADKQRYELAGDRIRALYGHSVPGRIEKKPGTPPDELFHGTAPTTARLIKTDGLRPMRRQFVHLSADREMASAVGGRKSAQPVILTIDGKAAHADGVTFYEGNDRVWLADFVPPGFIALAE